MAVRGSSIFGMSSVLGLTHAPKATRLTTSSILCHLTVASRRETRHSAKRGSVRMPRIAVAYWQALE